MKWRTVIIYGVVLLALVGYFYYFEVIGERKRKEAEEAQKKVFQLMPDSITSLKLTLKDGNEIVIKKEKEKWEIEKPVKTVADQASVKGLLNVMAELEAERWIEPSGDKDYKEYGLDSPSLKIEAFSDGKKYELIFGGKNPAETAYYAKSSSKSKIFLVDVGRWEVLNKSLFDLRRKELVDFEDDNVKAIKVSWSDGNVVEVVKESGKWVYPSDRKIKIKKLKVENVLDQLRWLRARKFLSSEKPDLVKYKLDKPELKVVITTVDDNTTTLHEILVTKPSEKEEKSKEFLIAYSSELPFVVRVDKDLLDEMPKTIKDLEDRSLFTWKEDDIHSFVWNKQGKSFEFTRVDESKWQFKGSDKEVKEMKESWRIRSLFWELEDLEYIRKVKPSEKVPQNPFYRFIFKDNESNILGEFIWNELPERDEKEVSVWVRYGSKGDFQTVVVKASDIKGVVDKADNLIKSVSKSDKGDKKTK